VEADEDTDVEVGGDADTGADAGGVAKSRHKTRSMLAKQSVSTTAAAVSAVKAAEKKRKRKASPLSTVETLVPTPHSREVESEEEEDEAIEEPLVVEDQPTRRSESPAAKRQRELVEKTTEDALRQGLEAQRTAATAQAKMPTTIRPRFFRPKPRVPAVTR
jgi:hypothetical protein